MKNQKNKKQQEKQKANLLDFKVYSLDTIERSGFKFKVSANNYDGGVLIYTENIFFNYQSIKYFSDPKQGAEWVDNLVSSARDICKHILSDNI